MSNKRFLIALLLIGGLACCGLALVALLTWQSGSAARLGQAIGWQPTFTPTPVPIIERTPLPAEPIVTPLPPSLLTPTRRPEGLAEATNPTPVGSPPSPEAEPWPSTEQALLTTSLPQRDQRLLALRLKAAEGQDIPVQVNETAPQRQVGDRDTFWVTDNQQEPPRQFEIEATLQYITPHSYWWIQTGFDVDDEALRRSADRFENQTYPTNRAFFGSEWTPGVDNDPHLHILMGDVPGVAGYFSASNEYSRLAEPFSNEREMFFINLHAITPGNDYFDGVLAHEFQHMIHWNQDRNEDTWINEGLSELATFLNGYGPSNFVGAFTATPDTQLTGWADSPSGATANYGGSFMFMAYFLQRFGEEMTQAVVANPANGIAGFDAVLAEHGLSERFTDIFADFLVANFLQEPQAGSGLWGYVDVSASPASINKLYRVYPQSEKTTVYQFGADYVELAGFGEVTVEFTGSTQVKVVNNTAHSGAYQWYSHRGDDSNTRLTRAFDLTGVKQATLTYWTWYDIEADWDYGYVEISTDGGRRWTILQTPHSATTNPSGNAYGPGYTGASDGWLEERIDLSPYSGQKVLIRFEYVTDDAVNKSGWTIDDVAIPEIGFSDDMESGANGWEAEGFVRIDNILPQRFLANVLEIGAETRVRAIPLDATNHGVLTIKDVGGAVERAILIVSGVTPVTGQPASYEYRLTAGP